MDTQNTPLISRFLPGASGMQHWHANEELPDHLQLADGRSVEVAPVRPQDSDAESAFVSALSLASRYRRFHFGLRELTPEQARAMTEIDQHHHVAIVARAALGAVPDAAPGAAFDNDSAKPAASAPMNSIGRIVADARYVLRVDSGDAEFAIAVADEWQGAGLGREMLQRLAMHAREQGVHRLLGDVLWGNNSMITLVRKLGGTLSRSPGDATVVRAEFVFSEDPAADVFFSPA